MTGKVLVRVVWPASSGRNGLCSGRGLRPSPCLASICDLSFLRGRAEGTDKFGILLPNHPTHLPAALHYLLLLSYLPTYTYLIYRHSHTCSNSVLHVLVEIEASRKSKKTTSHQGQTCTSPCVTERRNRHALIPRFQRVTDIRDALAGAATLLQSDK